MYQWVLKIKLAEFNLVILSSVVVFFFAEANRIFCQLEREREREREGTKKHITSMNTDEDMNTKCVATSITSFRQAAFPIACPPGTS